MARLERARKILIAENEKIDKIAEMSGSGGLSWANSNSLYLNSDCTAAKCHKSRREGWSTDMQENCYTFISKFPRT